MQNQNNGKKQEIVRPTKQEYYLNITKEIASRSNCLSAKIGAVIVKEDQIISTGYNGAPRKTKDCIEYGSCLRRDLKVPSGQRYELCRTVHAEQNSIINAARSGVSVLGGTMYMCGTRIFGVEKPEPIDAVPCFICKKMIINSGLSSVVCLMKNGTVNVYSVDNWAKEWAEKDMTDDVIKYDTSYAKK